MSEKSAADMLKESTTAIANSGFLDTILSRFGVSGMGGMIIILAVIVIIIAVMSAVKARTAKIVGAGLLFVLLFAYLILNSEAQMRLIGQMAQATMDGDTKRDAEIKKVTDQLPALTLMGANILAIGSKTSGISVGNDGKLTAQ